MTQINQTLVASSKGDIVTYDEHCKRLDAYLEDIKLRAMSITSSNRSLTSYIRSLQLIHGNVIIDTSGCRFFASLQSKANKVFVPSDGTTNASVALDDRGYAALYYEFLGLPGHTLMCMMGDYFLPRLARQRTLLNSLIKGLMIGNLHWTYVGEQKQGSCLEMTFEYHVPDFFWLGLPRRVRVLTGKYEDLRDLLNDHATARPHTDLFLVDISPSSRRQEQDYQDLLVAENFPDSATYVWNINSLLSLLTFEFRALAGIVAPVLKLTVREAFLLGEALADTVDTQDQLVQDLMRLETGKNIPHENIVKQILTFCFGDEFTPFHLSEQVETHDGSRRRDFIIYNSNPKEAFWRHLLTRGVEQILIDAKNYAEKLAYENISNTMEYLVNPAFGSFIIIVSRQGIADSSRLLDAYLATGGKQTVIVFNDDDLIEMIRHKREGKSPTSVIEERYHAFRHMK